MKIIQVFLQAIKNKLTILLKIFRQLPISHLISIFFYKFIKRFGIVRLAEFYKKEESPLNLLTFDFDLTQFSADNKKQILKDADEILSGCIMLFGMVKQELAFTNQINAKHWSLLHGDQFDGIDIKYVWEPARFSWGIRLVQAYVLSGDEKYAEFLWQKIEEFILLNPAFKGVQYLSAQEVAMRMITLIYCVSVLQNSSTSTKERMKLFGSMIEDHAIRIPSTLSYAKAQNNNHLISEAVGLYTAGTVLKNHSKAKKWRRIGRKTFEYGIQHQIYADGSYSQHSVRYQRLMLELSNWMKVVSVINGDTISDLSSHLIAKSVDWLSFLCNPETGNCPNLGPNDGVYLMPFSLDDGDDYRPVLQLSGALFKEIFLYRDDALFANFDWLLIEKKDYPFTNAFYSSNNHLMLQSKESYGYFRTEKFFGRPGHADQFHIDLWYQNVNVLLDAGTFSYNASPPWNNPLSETFYHNVLNINHQNQMTRGGKFLWLDWASAKKIEKYEDKAGKIRSISAENQGYAKDNVIHQRIVDVKTDEWLIKDTLFKKSEKKENQATVGYHLLIKNPLSFEVIDNRIIFVYKNFQMVLNIIGLSSENIILVKGGVQIFGETVEKEFECYGWFSTSYGVKEEVISLLIEDSLRIPTEILTKIRFE